MISSESSPPEPMNYAVLGEDSSSTEQKLAKYKGQVPWSYLAPHFKNGSLFYVDPQLKLEDVGAAFSENQPDQVDAWLKAGDLVKIGELHAAQWAGGATEFEALVVSPFILCRPL